MTAQPTSRDYNRKIDGNILLTLRASMAGSCEDIVAYIDSTDINDAILEFVCLDETSLTGPVPGDPPGGSFLVDLAVLEQEWNRVAAHFPFIAPSVNDISLISLRVDSDIPERQTLFWQYLVHRRYFERYAQRNIEGNVSDLLNASYNTRFAEIDQDIQTSQGI